MNKLLIILSIGVGTGESLSTSQLFLFWGIIILFIGLFIFFLFRTDKIIKSRNKTLAPVMESSHSIGDVSDEEAAAIALAIHMFKVEMHDMESLTITLKKVSRVYSPWSSKIYTLRQNPR